MVSTNVYIEWLYSKLYYKYRLYYEQNISHFPPKIDEKWPILRNFIFFEKVCQKIAFLNFKNWSKNRLYTCDLCGGVKMNACFLTNFIFSKNRDFFKNNPRYTSICVDGIFNFEIQKCDFLTFFCSKMWKIMQKSRFFAKNHDFQKKISKMKS